MNRLNGRITGKYTPGRFEKFMEEVDKWPPPYKEFNSIMAMNGYWWESFSNSVVEVVISGPNLVIIRQQHMPPAYKTLAEARTWLSKMGYEREDE